MTNKQMTNLIDFSPTSTLKAIYTKAEGRPN